MTPLIALILAAAAFASTAAHAARPLVTDDAGVLGARSCELEAATTRAKAKGHRGRERTVQAGCGIGWRSQVALGLSSAREDNDRSSGRALVGKTGLWQGANDAGLSLGWSLAWTREAGARWRRVGSSLNLIYSRPLAAGITLHANLGHVRGQQAPRRSTTWGLALEHEGWQGLAPMVELHGDDREAPWWNIGLRWTVVPDTAFVDAGYTRQISHEAPSAVSMGLKLAF